MTAENLLGLELDGELVLLDVAQARLIHLDARTYQIWRACDESTVEELAAGLALPDAEVRETLEGLAAAGVVLRDRDRWVRKACAWA